MRCKLLGDTSAALQHKRDLLQHALDHARQGITVIDKDRNLLAWNRAWLELYDLPLSLVKPGVKLDEIVRFNARRGLYGEGDAESLGRDDGCGASSTAPIRCGCGSTRHAP